MRKPRAATTAEKRSVRETTVAVGEPTGNDSGEDALGRAATAIVGKPKGSSGGEEVRRKRWRGCTTAAAVMKCDGVWLRF